jgi:cell division transport system ATP-binding protein
MSEVILKISDGVIRQRENVVLKDINLQIDSGEFVYLIGRTGSGKSSLLKTLYGELNLDSGTGNVTDFDLTALEKKQIPYLRRSIGVVFQDFQLLTDRSIDENLNFVMRSTGWTDKAKMKNRAEEVLAMVGLNNKGYRMPHELSGGEQQRVAIARALLNEPKLILADEPTGNLDPQTSFEIMTLIFSISTLSKTSVLMATHDLSMIEQFPARVAKVEEQTITEIKSMGNFDPSVAIEF